MRDLMIMNCIAAELEVNNVMQACSECANVRNGFRSRCECSILCLCVYIFIRYLLSVCVVCICVSVLRVGRGYRDHHATSDAHTYCGRGGYDGIHPSLEQQRSDHHATADAWGGVCVVWVNK